MFFFFFFKLFHKKEEEAIFSWMDYVFIDFDDS